jgi:Ankyrin repeats (3 copies)
MTERELRSEIVDAMDWEDKSILSALCSEHRDAIFRQWAVPGLNVYMTSAVDDGQIANMEVLLIAGVDINAPLAPGWRNSPDGFLVRAASSDQIEAARWLLDHGAVLNHTYEGRTRCAALSRAVDNNNMQMVKLLIERGAEVNAVGWHGETALDHTDDTQNELVAYLRSVGGLRGQELGSRA